MVNRLTNIFLYIVVAILAICSVLDIIAQPLLWPLALATVLLLIVELKAYRFPFIWYLYSHPYHARRHSHKSH